MNEKGFTNQHLESMLKDTSISYSIHFLEIFMQKIHSLVFIFGIRGWVIWLEGWGFKKVSGTDSHSVGVLEGAPGLRLYLKGLREGLLGVKQSFPGEQGFVGEA